MACALVRPYTTEARTRNVVLVDLMRIDLFEDDVPLIREFVDSRLIDLAKEINRTESSDFRETLRRTERALERLLGQLTLTGVPGE